MSHRDLPAIDHALAARSAVARDGQPLPYSRAPVADLAPWIARVYVSSVALPPEHTLSCGLYSEGSALRIQLDGQWEAQSRDGLVQRGRDVILFGPQSRRMPVTVAGGFTSVGVLFRPGAVRALGGPSEHEIADRLVDPAPIGVSIAAWLGMFDPECGPEEWCRRMEDALREIITMRASPEPDPLLGWFERASYADPSLPVAQIAAERAIELRRLERLVRRGFGVTPKHVMRRARVLDMACTLRGVADTADHDTAVLRFYDQSHLIREFTALIGMSPRQFLTRPQPLMTLTLETRAARRLEVLDRLEPGAAPPWLDRILDGPISRTTS